MSVFFTNVLDVARSLLEMMEDINSSKKKLRKELSELFENTGFCLATIAGGIRTGKLPHGRMNKLVFCFESLREHLDEMEDGIPIDLDKVFHMICEVDDIDRVLKKIHDSKKKEAQLGEIEEAAGKFMVLAHLVVTR